MDSLPRTFSNENDSDEKSEKFPLPPQRAPLISIPDPSQNPKGVLPGELELFKWNAGFSRSAQSTPTKSRNGDLCGGNGSRFRPPHSGGKEWRSLSKTAKTMLEFKSPCVSSEVRHFDLEADPSFWNDHNVQVLIRIRPINCAESALQGSGRCLTQESAKTLTWSGNPETRFTFDHVACETISQEELFNVAGLPMVENCMSGYNSCIFAYGQTGGGKTYTMMGDIKEISDNHCDDRGMTPRIFELLFERIKEEEEKRKNENLKYTCKCSYLEIYNEQITDLLDPSSTNLQLREDLKRGVYVEDLKEHDVYSAEDVIELLIKGAANRKVAATSMNSESSRSHSVFTCRIESQWEKDSVVHLRFGRLNLVDLAGSERLRTSGAEGERLREAASINRSLSTLGLVIMTLVDIANGKHRHVPYRDSRLTFLLQDSLGGNSKTAVIANVSPSICSANETLSTLKFAQRAKLILNNAKVNEDASGDVMALQREIQRLKDQLSTVVERQIEGENPGQSVDRNVEFLKEALADSRKREKAAEDRRKSLEAKCAHMKLVVHDMKNQLRDGEIERAGTLTYDYVEQNNGLNESIRLVEERIDGELEDMKLFEQLTVNVNDPNGRMKSHSSAQQTTDPHVTRPFCMERQRVSEIGCLSKTESAMLHKEVDFPDETTFALLKRENQELQERLSQVTYENSELLGVINEKEVRIKVTAEEWEKAVADLTSFLLEGCQSLEDASDQINSILDSFPNSKTWINDHVERVMKVFIEKERSICNLKNNLHDAQKIGSEMKSKLNTLRGAMLAMTEAHESEHDEIVEEFKNCLGFSDDDPYISSPSDDPYSVIPLLKCHISDANGKLRTLKRLCSENINADLPIISLREKDSLTKGETERPHLGTGLELHDQISKFQDGFENFQRKLSGEFVHVESYDPHVNLSDQINTDSCHQKLRVLERKIEKMDANYFRTKEIIDREMNYSRSYEVEQLEQTTDLFFKLEEAHEMMKEADLMLQQLLLANENALIEAEKWKQTSIKIQTERDSLAAELERTKELLVADLAKDQFLLDQISSFVTELATLMGEFQEMMENHASAELNEIHSYAASSMHEIHENIVTSKLSVKSLFSAKLQGILQASFHNGNHHGSMDGGSIVHVRNSLGSVERDAETEEFPHVANLEKKREMITDIGFLKDPAEENKTNDNLTCFSSNSGGRDQKGNDLTTKIAKVDAMLCFKRGAESPARRNSEAPLLIPNNYLSIKSSREINRRETDRLNGSSGERKLSSVGEILKELRLVKGERDKLQEDVLHLNEKLDMARAMADENKAVAVKAREEAEASRIYSEEKEEEVRVLESSVSELESTIDVLENKVSEMADEVQRCQQIREELELRLQTLREPAFTRTSDSGAHHLPRHLDSILLDLYDSKKKVEELEKETTRQAKEIKRYEEHISEIMLHSEAQSSLYHQKFQNLESMVSDAKKIPSSANKMEVIPVRSRGSSSPFKCMSNLIQQMNTERDNELSLARIRVEELETLAANRQKQVCMLSARLAAVDNMTHDVIRDLLEVKLDMTNYADMIEMTNLKTVQGHDSKEKDDEIQRLKGMINDLLEEKGRWIEAMKGDLLATHEKLEKLQQQHQFLTAQNDMLKMDKRNLTRKIAEQDEIMKVLVAPKSFQELMQSPPIDEEIGPSRRRPIKPGRLLHSSRTSRYDDARDHRPKIDDHHPR